MDNDCYMVQVEIPVIGAFLVINMSEIAWTLCLLKKKIDQGQLCNTVWEAHVLNY